MMKPKKDHSNKYINWAQKHTFGIFIMNLILMLLLLLYSAGYFHPFLPLTINLIIFIAIILSVVLLGIRSSGIFILALFFWLLAAFLKAVQVDIWAERSAIYTFEALVVGVVLFVIESIFANEK